MNKHSDLDGVISLDQLSLEIFERLAQVAMSETTESALLVYDLSMNYLCEKEKGRSMEDCIKGYFSEKEDAELGAVDTDGVYQSDSLREMHSKLSRIRQQLESIIELEQGIQKKMKPILSCVQFEDAVSQRINHITQGWKIITRSLHDADTDDFEAVAEEVVQLASSADETELFYQEVLQRPVPELKQGDTSTEFFL